MVNKRLINIGAAEVPAAFDPLQNFETVTYTGNGSTQKITGYIRKGGAFNGSSSKIVLPSGSPFNDSNTIKAVSMWFRLPTTSSILYGFSVGSDNSGSYFFNLYISGSTIGGQVRDGGSSNQSTMAATWTADTDWHHVVWQLGSTEKEIYLDGNKLSVTFTNTGTANDTSWIDYPSYSGNVVGQIGVNRATASFSYSNGLKDQVRFFNKALSSSEVTTLYGETYASSTKSTTDIFGDGSGVALYELDDSANDTGSFPYGTGDIDAGQSAVFNGSSSVITPPAFGNTYPFTYSVWINPDTVLATSIITDTISGNRFLFGTQSSSFSRTNYFLIGQKGQNHFGTPSNTVVANTWSHVVLVATSVNNYSVYINGVLQTLTNFGGSIGGTASYAIGANGAGSEYFDGFIDQVRIYSSALSASDVEALVSETNVPTANLTAHYKLDGNANDETGSYNGTASNITYSDPAEFPLIQYNGTPTNVNFLGMAFQPDLVWIKNRDADVNHKLLDSIRFDGTNYEVLESNTTGAAAATTQFSSFDSNGFTLGGGASAYNGSGTDYVAWCWKAGGSVTPNNNTNGSITSTVSANQDAGFSIVKFTASSNTNDTLGHGLSSAPEMIIYKRLDSTSNWTVYTNVIDGSWDYLRLNLTDAKADGSGTWATSSTIKNISTSNNWISYCFHSVDGYQKIGSYTGTGSSGNSINVGFDPRFILFKNTSSNNSWWIHDSVRGDNNRLFADLSNAETTSGSLTTSSTGFTLNDANSNLNASGNTYIYLAIA